MAILRTGLGALDLTVNRPPLDTHLQFTSDLSASFVSGELFLVIGADIPNAESYDVRLGESADLRSALIYSTADQGAQITIQNNTLLYVQIRPRRTNGWFGRWSNYATVTSPTGAGSHTYDVRVTRVLPDPDPTDWVWSLTATASVNEGEAITYTLDVDFNGHAPSTGDVHSVLIRGQQPPLPIETFLDGGSIGDAYRAAFPTNPGVSSGDLQIIFDMDVWVPPFVFTRETREISGQQGDKITSIEIYGQTRGTVGPGIAFTTILQLPAAAPPDLAFAALTLTADAAVGSIVGSFSVPNGVSGRVYTFALNSNPGSLFSVDGSQVRLASTITEGQHDFTANVTDPVTGLTTSGVACSITILPSTTVVTTYDFSGGTLPGGVSVVRAGSAYRYKDDGTIESIAANLPRFQHDPVTGEYLGLMVGRAYAQLGVNSEAISSWSKTGIYANGAGSIINDPAGPTDLLGGLSFDFIKEDTTTGAHLITTTIPVGNISRYQRHSLYVKPPVSAPVNKFFVDCVNSVDYFRAYFDLTLNAGAGGTYTGPIAKQGGQGIFSGAEIFKLSNGMYRIDLWGRPKGASASGSETVRIAFVDDTTSAGSYTGTNRGLWIGHWNAYVGPVTDTDNTTIAIESVTQRFPYGASNATTPADAVFLPVPTPGIYDFRIRAGSEEIYVVRNVSCTTGWQFAWPVEASAEMCAQTIRAAFAPFYEADVDAGNIPAFLTFPEITTIGGDDAASITEVTDFSTKTPYVNAIQNTARPAHIKLTGSGDAPSVSTTGLRITSGRITIEGSPELVLGRGAPWQLGASAGQVQNIKLLNINFIAGIDPIAKPSGPTKAYATNSTPPNYGATMPAEGWGNDFDSRDGLQIEAAKDWKVEQTLIAGALDEGTEVWGSSAQLGIENGLFKNTIWAYQLSDPRDPIGRKLNSQAPHDKSLLAGYEGFGTPPAWLWRNVVCDTCIIAASADRNPMAMRVRGFQFINGLISKWYALAGASVQQHDHNPLAKDGSTVAYAGNLFHVPGGGVTNIEALGAIYTGAIDRGSAAWFGDPNDPTTWNWITDGVNFNLDIPIHWLNDISIRDGGSQRSIKRAKHFSSPYAIVDLSTAAKREAQWNRLVGATDSVTGTRSKDGSGNFILGDAGASTFTRATHQAIRDGSVHLINYPSEFPWAA